MKEVYVIAGSAIYCFGFFPYIRSTIKREIKPRIASWMTWSLTLGITTVATLSRHAYVSATLTGAAFTVVFIILITAIQYGDRNYTWIDGTSQAISILGIIGWLTTRDAVWAIIFSMVADFFGAVPTFYNGWKKPHDEKWLPFILCGIGAALPILSVTGSVNFVSAGFPIYLSLVGFALGINIYFRQKTIATKRARLAT